MRYKYYDKRFMVYAFEKYHPKGGISDFWNSYDHPSEFYQELAKDAEDKNFDGLYGMDIIQVFDSETEAMYQDNLIDGVPEKEQLFPR